MYFSFRPDSSKYNSNCTYLLSLMTVYTFSRLLNCKLVQISICFLLEIQSFPSIKFGKSYTKTAPVYYEPEPVVEQPKAEPVVEKPQPKPAPVVTVEPMKQSVFFALNSAKIQDDQLAKIESLVKHLEKYPTAKVAVTGYADKETGNPGINMILSEKRANNVADVLKAKGIAADRIVTDFKGDTVQPNTNPTENRVSICVVE